MRNQFHEDLDYISEQLVTMTEMASTAMTRSTEALLNADRTLAESVIAGDDDIDALRADVDMKSITLLARQQPVATDLRMVVTALQMSAEIERMGDLAQHIAKVARMSAPDSAVPEELQPTFQEMSKVCVELCSHTATAIETADAGAAVEIDQIDHKLDDLHKQMFAKLLDGWTHGMEAGVNVTLLSRYFERFGDHAVTVASRIVYLVTGTYGTFDEGLRRSEDN